MDRLLITGIPGGGKTTFGGKLQKEKGYLHIEMETSPFVRSLLRDSRMHFLEQINNHDKVIITWGFYPPYDNEDILFLKKNGFKLIWFDGDRNTFKNKFTERENRNPETLVGMLIAFDEQIKRINETSVIKVVNPISVNPFNTEGSFREFEDLFQEISSSK